MTNAQLPMPNPYHVLFICTGNICRSPMAQALLQHRYDDEQSTAYHGIRISSGGVRGLDGRPAHPLAQAIMRERRGGLAGHRARTVTPDLLARSDLILAMESGHRQWIIDRMPGLEGRVHRLGRWRDLEIRDPIGGTEADFWQTLQEIDACLEDWLGLLPRAGVATHDQPRTGT